MPRSTKWILIIVVVTILLLGSFIHFNKPFNAKARNEPPIFPSSALNKPLPKAHLVDVAGAELNYSDLQKGKVILVVVTEGCRRCLEEADFLNNLVNLRNDVRFYGIVPFGADRSVLKSAEAKFPFKLYFDEGGLLGQALQIDKVPIKLYLEGGILKGGWGGATNDDTKKSEFKKWLETA